MKAVRRLDLKEVEDSGEEEPEGGGSDSPERRGGRHGLEGRVPVVRLAEACSSTREEFIVAVLGGQRASVLARDGDPEGSADLGRAQV